MVAQRVVLERLGPVPESQCRQGHVILQAYCAQDGLLGKVGMVFARLGVVLRVRGSVGGVDGQYDDDGWLWYMRILAAALLRTDADWHLTHHQILLNCIILCISTRTNRYRVLCPQQRNVIVKLFSRFSPST